MTMAPRAKTWRRVAIHGSETEREAAFQSLLEKNRNSMAFRLVTDAGGPTSRLGRTAS